MPRDRPGIARVGQPVVFLHVRRIAGYNVKGSSGKHAPCFLHVTFHDIDLILQAIQEHAPSGHVCALPLDLQRSEMSCFRFCTHQDRDDPGAGAQVQDRAALRGLCKPREEYRIHAEAELLRILDDLQVIALQVIDVLSGKNRDRHDGSFFGGWLPAFCAGAPWPWFPPP